MIKQGDIIKHKASMDVAIHIISTNTNPETGAIEIYGIWINQGQTKSYPINALAQFFIKKEHITNWFKCNNPDSDFIRNEKWEQL